MFFKFIFQDYCANSTVSSLLVLITKPHTDVYKAHDCTMPEDMLHNHKRSTLHSFKCFRQASSNGSETPR